MNVQLIAGHGLCGRRSAAKYISALVENESNDVMQFIFMLTRGDATVMDAPAVLKTIEPLGIQHIGFKDVGASFAVMSRLAQAIKMMGARSYLEVVGETRAARLAAANAAVELGVDCLLGGTEVVETLAVLQGSGIEYYPYVGQPRGIPTQLEGDTDTIARDCARAVALGCAGCTLLAYRTVRERPIALIRAAKTGMGGSGRLIVAGSIHSSEQLSAINAANTDFFTVGSSAFDGSFSPRKGLLTSQLRDILVQCH